MGKLEQSPILGESQFTIPERNGKPVRPVRQAVHAMPVTLSPPERRSTKGFKLPSVLIYAVLVTEINPPEDQESVDWLLLTCLPISTLAQALLILQWYMARWEIEIFFRILKQGCKIEKLQFETEKRFAVCLAFYIIIAWRVLYVTMLGRKYPNIDCEALFDKVEWQTLYIIGNGELPPKEPPPLSVIILMLAKLGGFLGRRHDGFPGPQPIWIGLQRLRDCIWAIQSYQTATSISHKKQPR